MGKTESEFWRNHLRPLLRRNGIRFQRFEDSLSEGIPDICVFIGGKTVWVELKNKKLPVRSSTKIKVGLRPLQRVWHMKRHNDGIRTYILTRLLRGEDLAYYTLHGCNSIDSLYNGITESELKSKGYVFNTLEDVVDCLHKESLHVGL